MGELKWLLVGAGDIARKRVAAALDQAAGSQLVGVCDVQADSARALAALHAAAEVYTDLGEALRATAAEAVYVATPVGLHVPQAVAALESGRHVLVEKPLGLDAAQCEAAAAAARQNPRTAGCAYFRRLYPAYRQAREMLERGEFGRVVLVRMAYYSWFASRSDDPKPWRVTRGQGGGGPLFDMGSHMFDVLLGLLGMPATVFARAANLVHPWEVEDTASVLMTMPDGAQVSGQFGWSSQTWRHELEIVGTQAKVCWHPFDSGTVVKTVGRQVEELELPPAANVHLPLVEDFVEAVRQAREPACSLAEAARTNVVLDAVLRSSRERREVVL
ncbi:MAG: Gfo/Idh/MocA family oxidoreductase [Candidatus Latescibacterota bacterium]